MLNNLDLMIISNRRTNSCRTDHDLLLLLLPQQFEKKSLVSLVERPPDSKKRECPRIHTQNPARKSSCLTKK